MFAFNPQDSPEIVNNCISVKAAAGSTGYSQQYLRRLLRSGKLTGLKLGQVWLIELDSFEDYLVLIPEYNRVNAGNVHMFSIQTSMIRISWKKFCNTVSLLISSFPLLAVLLPGRSEILCLEFPAPHPHVWEPSCGRFLDPKSTFDPSLLVQ